MENKREIDQMFAEIKQIQNDFKLKEDDLLARVDEAYSQ